ncbi:ParB/RepB/Spo0J family partition protein [Pseudomonas syringae]|uniref:ParB/RepB/Spo0J family partition protein n=1 Tax=Pseudomonas syringae TaxID=317 RepID=UPI001D0FE2AB|nr:ParB/RepB/Spo0J family partition protein [Pseudomonas syringae]
MGDDPDYDHEVVAGNRRWTAAHDAGLIEVPALIRAMSDQEARLIAALENQVRADLTPIEEAQHAVILLEDMANDHLAVMKALDWSRTKLDTCRLNRARVRAWLEVDVVSLPPLCAFNEGMRFSHRADSELKSVDRPALFEILCIHTVRGARIG